MLNEKIRMELSGIVREHKVILLIGGAQHSRQTRPHLVSEHPPPHHDSEHGGRHYTHRADTVV